ncbi:MAG: hypothetical protein H7125_10050 [Proteobacteria bacterium]|nr:hypothetical protein [Burkholderiales bacterium]
MERRILAHDVRSNGEQLITRKEARALIASGHYRPSTGAPYGATHYRRSLDDGSCLHLVVEARRVRLHHDEFDPHANLVSLGMHVLHEARSEAVSCGALAWSMIKLLAR